MSFPVVLRPEAEQDLIAARDWYNVKRDDLGDEFVAEITGCFERLAEMPEIFAPIWEDVRNCRTHRFPYVIYYRALVNRVEVLAVLHGSRDPASWRSRA